MFLSLSPSVCRSFFFSFLSFSVIYPISLSAILDCFLSSSSPSLSLIHSDTNFLYLYLPFLFPHSKHSSSSSFYSFGILHLTLSIHPSIHPSIYLPVRLSACLSLCPSIISLCLSIIPPWMSVFLSPPLSVYLSPPLNVSLLIILLCQPSYLSSPSVLLSVRLSIISLWMSIYHPPLNVRLLIILLCPSFCLSIYHLPLSVFLSVYHLPMSVIYHPPLNVSLLIPLLCLSIYYPPLNDFLSINLSFTSVIHC